MRKKFKQGAALAMAAVLLFTGLPLQSLYAQVVFEDGSEDMEESMEQQEELFSSGLQQGQRLISDGSQISDISDTPEEATGEGSLLALNGEGTQENPFTISSAEELKNFRDSVNAGDTFAGKYVALMQDIDLEGENLGDPIGKNSILCFAGTFDGKGHTIRGLNITGGLFGYVGNSANESGRICNLIVSGNVERGSLYYVGGIVGTLNYPELFTL